MGAVQVGGTYTLTANVAQLALGDLKAWGIPTSTAYELAGIEIGVEGYQFAELSLSWSTVMISSVSLS